MPAVVRIIGIDPGSRITGYGVIDFDGTRIGHVASGCIRVRGEDLAGKLKHVFDGVTEAIDAHRPGQFAIEQVFMHKNAGSALKLGQARGAAILAAATHAVDVFEYSPNAIKQSVTGHGHATKEQVQHMVRVLASLREPPQSDAADALAVAICHGHANATRQRIARAVGGR